MVGQAQWNRPNKASAGVGEKPCLVYPQVPTHTVHYGPVLQCSHCLVLQLGTPLGGTLENHSHHFFFLECSTLLILTLRPESNLLLFLLPFSV